VISAPQSAHFQLPLTVSRGVKSLSDLDLSKSIFVFLNEKSDLCDSRLPNWEL